MRILIKLLANRETRHPMCNCGACCDQCGHDRGCMSQGDSNDLARWVPMVQRG